MVSQTLKTFVYLQLPFHDHFYSIIADYHHGGSYGSMPADMVLEKELLHIGIQTSGSRLRVTLNKA